MNTEPTTLSLSKAYTFTLSGEQLHNTLVALIDAERIYRQHGFISMAYNDRDSSNASWSNQVKETKTRLTHDGRRPGAGRPPVDRVRKTYKLDPWVIANIQKIAEEFAYTESCVANELLWKALNMKLDESTFTRIPVSTKWGG